MLLANMPGNRNVERSNGLKTNIIEHWPILAILLIWWFLFFDINTGQSVVGYRDSAYLYYPYFHWIDLQWQRGEIPLWNPHCNSGYPVVADGTSSVFYPGKLIFLLRFLSYPSRYGLYSSLHVLLAAVHTYIFVWRLGGDKFGSAMAGFSYAFGGSVLFQLTNVVYLVSASWLPLGLMFVATMHHRSNWKSAVGLGVTMAMIVLGGDPQMACVLMLGAGATWVGHGLAGRKRHRSWRSWLARWSRGANTLLIATIVGVSLSAIQVLPSWVWTHQSVRTEQLVGVGVGEKSLESKPGTHLHAVYEFSHPPWSLAEMVWPNLFGKLFPENDRWGSALPGADRVWSPSSYVGFPMFLIGCCTLQFYGNRRRRVWLSWLVVWFAAASFGWYGMSWAIKELLAAAGTCLTAEWDSIGNQVGGVYWLMTLLPGFDCFRYPAKLFVIASLGISALAGLGVNEFFTKRRAIVLTGLAIGFSVVGALGSDLFCAKFQERIQYCVDPFFGPLDYVAMSSNLRTSFLQTGTIGCGLLALIAAYRRRKKYAATVVLFLTLFVDVLLANVWLLAQVQVEVFEAPTVVERQLFRRQPDGLRVFRYADPPQRWSTERSMERLSEIVWWQRESLHPKHHLRFACTHDIGLVNSFTSIEHRAAKKIERHGANSLLEIGLRKLVDGVVHFDEARDCGDVHIVSQLSSRIRVLEHGRDIEQIIEAMAIPQDLYDRELESVDAVGVTFEVCTQNANSFSVRVDADKQTTLLCSVLADPGWKVRITNDGEVRAGELLNGSDPFLACDVPAGSSLVEFYYCPIEFWIGAAISGTAWLVLLVRVISIRARRASFNF